MYHPLLDQGIDPEDVGPPLISRLVGTARVVANESQYDSTWVYRFYDTEDVHWENHIALYPDEELALRDVLLERYPLETTNQPT